MTKRQRIGLKILFWIARFLLGEEKVSYELRRELQHLMTSISLCEETPVQMAAVKTEVKVKK